MDSNFINVIIISVFPESKLGNFLPLMLVISQDLALKQGASRLQTTSPEL
jgi:hypothetical protein